MKYGAIKILLGGASNDWHVSFVVYGISSVTENGSSTFQFSGLFIVFELAVPDRYFHVISLFPHCCSALLFLCGKRRQDEKDVLVVFARMAHCRSQISHRTFVPVWHQHPKQGS